ncbi:MAG: PDZ domain-containing protein [Oscillospiraceae bacterium]|nr:PDZ domain-containing protein [Oscillospiraceae bacterium]
MNRKNTVIKVILRVASYMLVAALAASAAYMMALGGSMSKLEYLEEMIDRYFIEDYDSEKINDAAADAMVNALGNRWSYYIPASEYKAHVERQQNAYVGIGITIQPVENGKGVEIVKVEPGGSAEEAGLQVGDIIIRVGDQGAEELSVDNAKTLVQGEAGTTVEITVLRDDKEQTFTVERREIKVVVATGVMLENNVGYIKINNFNDRSAAETIALIEKLRKEGATALLFDVRFNPGGYKDEMVQVLDHLLPEGDLFRSVDYEGNETVDKSDEKCLKMPMAVLVNPDSYSAAEFFAAALKEYAWATVVGQPTTGKSHFQVTLDLGDGSAVNLSVGKYLTPKGVSLADVGGLKPDKIVEVEEELYANIYYGTVKPEEDPQIIAALELLKTAQ